MIAAAVIKASEYVMPPVLPGAALVEPMRCTAYTPPTATIASMTGTARHEEQDHDGAATMSAPCLKLRTPTVPAGTPAKITKATSRNSGGAIRAALEASQRASHRPSVNGGPRATAAPDELAVAVVHAAARTLGDPVRLGVLEDERLAVPETATEVATAASYHGVVPLLWQAVEQSNAPAALGEAVRDAYLPLVARGLRLQHLLHVVDEALTAAGVRYAVYKGPATARHYPTPELRAFSDVDLLIARRDRDRVNAALHEAGLAGGWSGVPDGYAETGYYLNGFGALDLHWHVMREEPTRAAFALDTDAMLARAARVPHADGSALMLDAADELIAVATHACYDGAYRLGWMVDIARLLRDRSLDRDELRRRCIETRTALPVQVILDRTCRALGVADEPELARGSWRALLNGVAAARPVQRTFRQVGRGGLIFRATRPSSARSFAALGHTRLSRGATSGHVRSAPSLANRPVQPSVTDFGKGRGPFPLLVVLDQYEGPGRVSRLVTPGRSVVYSPFGLRGKSSWRVHAD